MAKIAGEGHSTEPDKRAVIILPVRNLLKCGMQISQTQIIQEWTEADSNDPGTSCTLMKKLFPRSEKLYSEEEDEGEEEEGSLQYVSSGQAADMLEQCLMWYENQTEATATLLMLLKQIRDLAVKNRWRNLKQSTLRYFVKQ